MRITFKAYMQAQIKAIVSSGLPALEWISRYSESFRKQYIIN